MYRTLWVVGARYGVLTTLCTLLVTGTAMGLPCRGLTPVPGETQEEVTGKCGPAALKEHREVTVKETGKQETRTTTTIIDEWTYEFGPEELRQTYYFENGKLASIRNSGYGRMQDDRGEDCQNGQLLAVGDSTVDAYVKCGEPLARENKNDKVTEIEENGTRRQTIVSVVEWTYRYGPDLPGYTLRFEDGKTTDIRTREFGK